MSNGGQIPPQLAPLLQQYLNGSSGLMNAAQATPALAPQAGASPLPAPAQPNLQPLPQQPQNQNPYQSFLTALQQIQQANPIQAIGQATPPAHKSAGAQKATMQETGVG